MSKIIEFLSGKKTALVAVAVAVVTVLREFGIEVPDWVIGLLGALGLGAVRAAIKKAEP